jgi:hypothetical protein
MKRSANFLALLDLERGDKMSNQTLIIVIVLVVLLFGGFGYRRWRR